jgi:SAM-dependent methyltransferase
MTEAAFAREWARILAPRTGDVRTELVGEAAEFLGIPEAEAWHRLQGATDRFRDEWITTVADSRDPSALVQFYNQSDTELFELIEWHASNAIHYRTLIVRDWLRTSRRMTQRPAYLDYGSGIGADALVFAEAGFDVALADISECLLAFAAWRCRRRGFSVRTINLKRGETLPRDWFDLVVCFDVLEHIPKPLDAMRDIQASMRAGGLLALHAPFGEDPERPMHVVHRDVVTPRMRSMGLFHVDCPVPAAFWFLAPRVYEKQAISVLDRAGYFFYDNYLNNAVGDRLAAIYRRTLGRLTSAPA